MKNLGHVRMLPSTLEMQAAFQSGQKRTFRAPVTAKNSIVTPGNFEGLDLETGRRRLNPVPELRARCRFPTAETRAVTVLSKVRPGDLFWVKSGAQTRAASTFTLIVQAIDVCRLQDITREEVEVEGAPLTPVTIGSATALRDWFARTWDQTHLDLGERWKDNPWVWVYRVKTVHENIDMVLQEPA